MTKPVTDWTLDDLLALIGLEESTGLEFKRSEALEKTTKNSDELAKDISAMANAAGGILVYGMIEANFVATSIDDGTAINTEWIDQVLSSNVEPVIAGVLYKRILLPSGKFAVVVEVPQATTFAPHQSRKTKRYHVRRNNTVEAMADYEIRDAMRRRTAPELWLAFNLTGGAGSENATFAMSIVIGNHSNEPALYHTHDLSFETAMYVGNIAGYAKREDLFLRDSYGNDHPANMFSKNFAVPASMPIFKERQFEVARITINVAENTLYHFFYQLSCPGFHIEHTGHIVRNTGEPRIVILS